MNNLNNSNKDNNDEKYLDELINGVNFDTGETYDNQSIDTERNNKRRIPHLSKPLLGLGVVMIAFAIIVPKTKSNGNEYAMQTAISTTTSTSISSSTETETVTTTVNIPIIVDDSKETIIEQEQRLSNVPVEVTPEVDFYFNESVMLLKEALKVDEFIVNNKLFGNDDMIRAFKKLNEDFNSSIENWKTLEVPAGCEGFGKYIAESIKIYQYYFSEVMRGTELDTQEEFNSCITASVQLLQTQSVLLDSKVLEDFYPVFYYYGLYN